MRRLLAVALLAVLLLAPARAQLATGDLAVTATQAHRGALIVTWSPPADQQLACVQYQRGGIIGCVGPSVGALVYGPGSVDITLDARPGERIEVRAWDAEGMPLAQGWGRLGSRLYLPLAARP